MPRGTQALGYRAAKRGCKGRRAPSLGTWDADFPVSSYGGRKAGMQGAASP
ncbi:hypothetical protein [Dictyobacter kobayashii]|nr:hypothetical protein [Dictyobacter kobayashii]